MTTHAQLLEELERRWPQHLPNDDGEVLMRQPDGMFIFVDPAREDSESNGYEVRLFDAHAHIELACWRVVREWCKAKECTMIVNDLRDVCIMCDDSGDFEKLGRGPTDADALLAALKHIGART